MTTAHSTDDNTAMLKQALDSLPEVNDSLVFEDTATGAVIAAVVPRLLPHVTAEPGELLVDIPTGHRVSSVNPHETLFQYEEIFTHRIYTGDDIQYPRDAVVLDVGANIGMYAVFIAHHLPDARVVSFEPVDSIRERLQRNVSRYAPNAIVLPFGLAHEEGRVEFTSYKGYSMMSSRSEDAHPEEERESIKRFLKNSAEAGDENAALMLQHIDVILDGRFEQEITQCRLRRLSDVIDELKLDRVDVLKIDVQRAELDVLRGLEDRHLKNIGVIVMEIHDDGEGKTKGRVKEVERLLGDAGFRVSMSQDENLQGTDRWDCVAVREENLKNRAGEFVQFPDKTVKLSTQLDADKFEQQIRDTLPKTLQADRFILLDAIPHTQDGKPDIVAIQSKA